MDHYATSVLANHLSAGGQPLCETDLARLVLSGLIGMDDVERVPAPDPTHGIHTHWRVTSRRWATALEDCGSLLVPATFEGPKSAMAIYSHHMATGETLDWRDLIYLDLSGAADAEDFVCLGDGRWQHRSLPDRVMHLAVCCLGPHILGVHAYSDLEEARDTALLFLQAVHGLPEGLSWPIWTTMVEFGITPPAAGATSVWSVPIEPTNNE